MPALDDDYSQQYRATLEEMARQEYERRQREQERYAPPGAPTPMAPSEYVVAQAPIPPPLRANEAPMGQDRRASPVSALDMQEPRASFETLAQQGQQPLERYVPQSGVVAPMYPNSPAQYGPIPSGDVATAAIPPGPTDQQVPPPMPLGMPGAQPGVSSGTRDVLAADREPPVEYALPPPGPLGMPGRQVGVSQETRDILAEHGVPATPSEPARAGDIIFTLAKGLHRAKGGETDGISLPKLPDDITFSMAKGLHRKGSAVGAEPPSALEEKPVAEAAIPPVASSSTAPATTPSSMQPGGPLTPRPTVQAQPGEAEPVKQKGGGRRQRAISGREEFPDVSAKANIDPRYLVRLEQTNPALHDSIVSAAAAAGIGSWEYANLIYSASKGDPNYRDKDGHMGIAGLKQEDIDRYQRQYPEMFRDPQGNPISPMDPATNMILGAQKYREMRDYYGAGTPDSIVGYYLGVERTNQLAHLPPDQQRTHMPAATLNRVQAAISPDAKEGEAKALQLNGGGTLTAPQVVQTAVQAARTGDTRPFISMVAEGVPRGMSSGDGWRHVEALGVGAMLMKGNVEGAQKVRELIFQMSHVTAVQNLMMARQAMGDDGKGDLAGAAKFLAQAYYATPDGGMGKFYVTPQGLYAQRYNETTGQKVGNMFQVTPQLLDGMLNMAKDPQTFLKTQREGQKLNAEIVKNNADAAYHLAKAAEVPSEIAHKQAQTALARAQAEDVPAKREVAQDLITQRYFHDVLTSLKPGAGGANRDPAIAAGVEKEYDEMFPTKDLTGQPTPPSREQAAIGNLFKDMKINSPRLAKTLAADIAKDLYDKGGAYGVKQGPGGTGVVYSRSNPSQPLAVFSPHIAGLLIARPVPGATVSPIGATPAPAGR